MRKSLYLDMDGVLADFCGGSLVCHNRLDILDNYAPGEWSIGKQLGISEEEFWVPIDAAGVEFWSELAEYPWTRDLLNYCQSLDAELVFLTDPSGRATAMHGKKVWLDRVLGTSRYKVFYGKEKWRLSAPGCVLVDDSMEHKQLFENRPDNNPSGKCVLFPQDWNTGKMVDPLSIVLPQIAAALG